MSVAEERKNNYEEIEKELGLDEEEELDAEEQEEDEDDYDDDDWDDDDGPVSGGGRVATSATAAATASASARATNQEQLFAKVQGRINLEPLSERSEKSVTKQERKEDELRCVTSIVGSWRAAMRIPWNRVWCHTN